MNIDDVSFEEEITFAFQRDARVLSIMPLLGGFLVVACPDLELETFDKRGWTGNSDPLWIRSMPYLRSPASRQ